MDGIRCPRCGSSEIESLGKHDGQLLDLEIREGRTMIAYRCKCGTAFAVEEPRESAKEEAFVRSSRRPC